MDESKQHQHQQNQLFIQMQHQQQMQQRQQQLFLMQQLQKQQQQQSAMFPTNLRPPGLTQNRPVNPFLQNANPSPNVMSQQQMMMMQQQQQKSMMMMQQQQKSMSPLNQLELQFAYQDSWRVCHPDLKRPFESLEDACERLLPYHVVADYEAEEDDRILDSETLSRSQLWDNNIAAKVTEFSAIFEKQVEAFNVITRKLKDGESRSEERLGIEQAMLHDERRACLELKSELDREMKAREARLRMAGLTQAGQVKAESQQQSHIWFMATRNPLRANAIGNYGEQGHSTNPNEMMMLMMNGWGNQNNNNTNSQREEKEPLDDFLNDEENANGGTGEHGNWRGNGQFDLNTR